MVDRRERRPRPGPIAHQDLLSPRALDSDRWSDARLEPLFIDRDEYTGVEEEVPSDMHFYTGRYLEQAQLQQQLEDAVRRLPDHQRIPIVLFHFEDMSYQDIAVALGVSLGKVKTDIHRGREALRKQLTADHASR